jgi:hypothetical protein
MEIAIWTFIVFILVALFKTLKYEESNAIYNEKELLKRYFEIKKISPDCRVFEFKAWEISAKKILEQNEKQKVGNIIKFKVFDNSKRLS